MTVPRTDPLPPKLYHGKTIRVLSFNNIEAQVDLGFGVSVQKRVYIEGIDRELIKSMSKAATHCLVVLLGGKRILLHVQKPDAEGQIIARVYLNERVYHDPEGFVTPAGVDKPMLEIGIYMPWLAGQGFDIATVKRTLNGK